MVAERDDAGIRAAFASAGCVVTTGVVVLPWVEAGPLTLQMVQHLLVMNVVAPVLAALVPGRVRNPGLLWPAAVVQLVLLYAWHAPSLQTFASASVLWHAAFMIGLAVSAFWFWLNVLGARFADQWRGLGGLLLTGKLACLLGALLIFAPRDLYQLDGVALPFCTTGPSSLADQHLAGLLMITACPLSYLVAGVVLAGHMLFQVERAGSKGSRLAPP